MALVSKQGPPDCWTGNLDAMEATTLALSAVAAIGALLAAGAAWRSARASERATGLTERAALLDAIPVLVPWVEKEESRLSLKNRGKADAHELKWRIEADGESLWEGEMSDVIPAGGSKKLTSAGNAVVNALGTRREVVIVCEYLTSWGESLTLKRMYRDGKSAGIRLLDADGEVLKIGGSGAA